ncbi:MAG: hypothetical protein OEV30_00055 [Ignavibacteria bacterium]|nr:hypothetical protein [Ignavibacteria bacterium]
MKNLSRIFLVASLAISVGLVFSGCKDDENPTDPGLGGGGITSPAFPNNTANLAPGGAAAVGTLSGGTPPYAIKTAPNASVATAALSGTNMEVLTITPVAVGTTSVTIEDASTASNDSPSGLETVISIVVSEGGGGGGTGIAGSGTMTLNTSIANFSASGTYNENAVSGQGVGGVRYSTGDNPSAFYRLDLIAYNARSLTDADLVVMSFQSAENQDLMTGNFSFTPMGGAFANASFGFGINLSDPNAVLYTTLSGSTTLASLTQTTASVIKVSGDALNPQNPTMTAQITGGAADVNGIGQGDAPFGDTEIERAVLEFYQRWKAQQDVR